eukprot:7387567-Prymnesium_polylepis.1
MPSSLRFSFASLPSAFSGLPHQTRLWPHDGTAVRAENVYRAIQLGAACGRRGERDSLILAVDRAFSEYTLHHIAIGVADDDGE